jgi:hypothetical protein
VETANKVLMDEHVNNMISHDMYIIKQIITPPNIGMISNKKIYASKISKVGSQITLIRVTGYVRRPNMWLRFRMKESRTCETVETSNLALASILPSSKVSCSQTS